MSLGGVFHTGFEGNRLKPLGVLLSRAWWRLASEAVDGSSLALEGVDNVEGGDGLAAGVFCVGDRVTDDGLQERLEDSAGLLVDEAGDSLDSTAAGETADGGLGDSLDVVPKDLAVALGSSLAEALSSLATSGHLELGFFACLENCEECYQPKIQVYLSSKNEPICLDR